MIPREFCRRYDAVHTMPEYIEGTLVLGRLLWIYPAGVDQFLDSAGKHRRLSSCFLVLRVIHIYSLVTDDQTQRLPIVLNSNAVERNMERQFFDVTVVWYLNRNYCHNSNNF